MNRTKFEPLATGPAILEIEPSSGGSVTARSTWSVSPDFSTSDSLAENVRVPNRARATQLVAAQQTATAWSFLPAAGRTNDFPASVAVRRSTVRNDVVDLDDLKYGNSVAVTFAHIDQLPAIVQSHHADWEAVSPQTVNRAKTFLLSFWRTVVQAGLVWVAPHVASDAQGAVTFEWWHGSHTLTIYVEPRGAVSYLTAWGLHIWDEMDEGANPAKQELIEMWKWLQSGK